MRSRAKNFRRTILRTSHERRAARLALFAVVFKPKPIGLLVSHHDRLFNLSGSAVRACSRSHSARQAGGMLFGPGPSMELTGCGGEVSRSVGADAITGSGGGNGDDGA